MSAVAFRWRASGSAGRGLHRCGAGWFQARALPDCTPQEKVRRAKEVGSRETQLWTDRIRRSAGSWQDVIERDYYPWDNESRLIIDTAMLTVDDAVQQILDRVTT